MKRNSKIEKYLQLRVGCRDVTEKETFLFSKNENFMMRNMEHGSYLFLLFAMSARHVNQDKTF